MLFISSTKLKCVIIILVTVVNKKKKKSSLYLCILKSYAKSFSYCLLHSAVLTHLLNHLVTQMLAGERDACDLDSIRQTNKSEDTRSSLYSIPSSGVSLGFLQMQNSLPFSVMIIDL